MNLDALINENYKKLNENDLQILQFVQSHKLLCSELSIAELAYRCNVSSATILRTAKKLGFSGYSEFKYFIKRDNSDKQEFHVRNTIEDLESDIQQTIKIFQQNNINNKIYEMIDKASTIYAYGTGYGQQLMVKEFARCLLNVKKNLVIIPAFTELEIACKNFDSTDLFFIVSLSGNMNALKETILNLDLKKAPVISITNFNNNELASFTKYNFYFQSSNINKENNLNQSSFVTLHLLLHLIYEGYVDFLRAKKNAAGRIENQTAQD